MMQSNRPVMLTLMMIVGVHLQQSLKVKLTVLRIVQARVSIVTQLPVTHILCPAITELSKSHAMQVTVTVSNSK